MSYRCSAPGKACTPSRRRSVLSRVACAACPRRHGHRATPSPQRLRRCKRYDPQYVTNVPNICRSHHNCRREGADAVATSKPAAPAIRPSRHSSLKIHSCHLLGNAGGMLAGITTYSATHQLPPRLMQGIYLNKLRYDVYLSTSSSQTWRPSTPTRRRGTRPRCAEGAPMKRSRIRRTPRVPKQHRFPRCGRPRCAPGSRALVRP